jgi:hypothetical protein
VTKLRLVGGPLHGKTVELRCPGTLHIVLRGQAGRYNIAGVWEPDVVR